MGTRSAKPAKRIRTAFTLLEVLVVVAVIALLLAVLLPSLKAARCLARFSVCGSNIRQLALANLGYATENKDYFVLAAEDIFVGFGGTKRWHGVRESAGVSPDPEENRFDPARGPLVRYVGRDGKVKQCPSLREYVEDGSLNAFEAGCGGYGYNHTYVGGRADLYGIGIKAAKNSAKLAEIRQPVETVMFTDAAFAQCQPPDRRFLIEYSFCEPPLIQMMPGEPSNFRPVPSIHFRHRDQANVAWCDGHVDSRRMEFSAGSLAGISREQMEALRIGWFGPQDNSVFDLK